jgi:hypothetical protein
MPNIPPDVEGPISNNETWNTCPHCNTSWKDTISTPGLIHRTRSCDNCKRKLSHEVEGHMWENKK